MFLHRNLTCSILHNNYTLSGPPQHVLNTLNPHWPAFRVESRLLCGGDPSRSVRVRCYDWDEASSPDLIGEFFTTVAEMGQAAEGKTVRDS